MKSSFIQRFFAYGSGTFLVLIGLILIFTLSSPEFRFLRSENIKVLLALGSEFGIISLAVGVLMICGEFDLSVGSLLVFSMYVFIVMFEMKIDLVLVAFVVLAVGALLGLVNALVVTKGRIPSFIATLGTMMLWRGMTLFLSLGFTRPFNPAVSPLFCSIFTGEVGGIFPVQAVWFTVFAVILGAFLHLHKFGNWVYATGDNVEAARAMGVNTDRVKAICFMIVGVLCAFVAIIQTIRVSSFFSRAGDGWELKAVAASVVGGVSLRGGIGSMAGIFLGALAIQIIENGVVLLRIDYFWVYVVIGLILILSVLLSTYFERIRLVLK